MTGGRDEARDFAGLERVVGDDLRFRLRLGIGEDAYRAIRYGKALQKLWDLGGVAATGAAAAKLPVVAAAFFAPSGLAAFLPSGLAALLGLGAATPIGWVIAAGVASAGAYYGVLRLVGNYGDKRVSKVPAFINTPVDLLGATLVDLIGTLAVKLAEVDGTLPPAKRDRIVARFVSDWGIDPPYAEKAVRLIAGHAQRIALPEAAAVLGRFLRENEDCNAQAIREDILAMLREIVQVEGRMDVTEDQALAEIDRILRLETEPSLRRTTGQIAQRLGQGAAAAVAGIGGAGAAAVSGIGTRVGGGARALGRRLRRKSAPRPEDL